MPQSSMSADEKARVKNVLSADNKILMASVARIYYAHPDPNSWTFSGEQGGLAFVKDKTTGIYHFKLVDLQGTRGVIWEHELYEDFTLNEDRPFFHSFAGDVSKISLTAFLKGSFFNIDALFIEMYDRSSIHRRRRGELFHESGYKEKGCYRCVSAYLSIYYNHSPLSLAAVCCRILLSIHDWHVNDFRGQKCIYAYHIFSYIDINTEFISLLTVDTMNYQAKQRLEPLRRNQRVEAKVVVNFSNR